LDNIQKTEKLDASSFSSKANTSPNDSKPISNKLFSQSDELQDRHGRILTKSRSHDSPTTSQRKTNGKFSSLRKFFHSLRGPVKSTTFSSRENDDSEFFVGDSGLICVRGLFTLFIIKKNKI
jgi:hypothetical protein